MQDCAGAGPFSLPNFRDVGLLFKHYSTVTVVVPSIYGAEDGCDVSLLVDGEGGGWCWCCRVLDSQIRCISN